MDGLILLALVLSNDYVSSRILCNSAVGATEIPGTLASVQLSMLLQDLSTTNKWKYLKL
jgi:hypothetical protein